MVVDSTRHVRVRIVIVVLTVCSFYESLARTVWPQVRTCGSNLGAKHLAGAAPCAYRIGERERGLASSIS